MIVIAGHPCIELLALLLQDFLRPRSAEYRHCIAVNFGCFSRELLATHLWHILTSPCAKMLSY